MLVCVHPSLLCDALSSRLEGVASTNVLQFLRDLRWRSIQLLCHTFLLVRVHAVELLTQISINHILQSKTEKLLKKLVHDDFMT